MISACDTIGIKAPSKRLILLCSLAITAALLPSAPVISHVSQSIGLPLQAVLLTGLAIANILTPSPHTEGLFVAALLSAVGLDAVLLGGDAQARVWIGTVVLPLLLFVAINRMTPTWLTGFGLGVRWGLLITVGFQVVVLVQTVGLDAFNLRTSFAAHTDVVFWERVGGQVLGNPNNASVVFSAAFAWAAAEFSAGCARRSTWVMAGLSLGCLVATGSRGAMITAGFVVIVALVASPARGARKPLIAVAAAIGGYVLVRSAGTVIDMYRAGGSQSLAYRSETRLAALDAIAQRPFGTGAGTADLAVAEALGHATLGDASGATAHDVFLNWGLSLGWVGLIVLIFVVIRALSRLRRRAGVIHTLPIVAFLVSSESAGIDLLNDTNPAWVILFWALIGMAWRGAPVCSGTGALAQAEAPSRGPSTNAARKSAIRRP